MNLDVLNSMMHFRRGYELPPALYPSNFQVCLEGAAAPRCPDGESSPSS